MPIIYYFILLFRSLFNKHTYLKRQLTSSPRFDWTCSVHVTNPPTLVITYCFVFLARREHFTSSCTFVKGILWIQLDSVHTDPGGFLLWVWSTDWTTCGWHLCLSALVSVLMYVASPNPLSVTSCPSFFFLAVNPLSNFVFFQLFTSLQFYLNFWSSFLSYQVSLSS